MPERLFHHIEPTVHQLSTEWSKESLAPFNVEAQLTPRVRENLLNFREHLLQNYLDHDVNTNSAQRLSAYLGRLTVLMPGLQHQSVMPHLNKLLDSIDRDFLSDNMDRFIINRAGLILAFPELSSEFELDEARITAIKRHLDGIRASLRGANLLNVLWELAAAKLNVPDYNYNEIVDEPMFNWQTAAAQSQAWSANAQLFEDYARGASAAKIIAPHHYEEIAPSAAAWDLMCENLEKYRVRVEDGNSQIVPMDFSSLLQSMKILVADSAYIKDGHLIISGPVEPSSMTQYNVLPQTRNY